ncbi:RNA-directed DNA polymerase, eukaryota [Tanacetum coccineum]
MIIAVYGPHDPRDKLMLWDYLAHVINQWQGELVIMGDFNEVHVKSDRFGTNFNVLGVDIFNSFINFTGLEEVHLRGSAFTWCHKIVNAGMFKGIVLDQSLCLLHMFYVDDAIFLEEWSDGNISTLIYVLNCFFHASGLKINLNKSKIMGINVESAQVIQAAAKLGCLVLKCPFYYLGTRVGGSMTRVQAWQEIVEKVKSRLSKWKSKTIYWWLFNFVEIGFRIYSSLSHVYFQSSFKGMGLLLAIGWLSILSEVRSLKESLVEWFVLSDRAFGRQMDWESGGVRYIFGGSARRLSMRYAFRILESET